MNELKPNLKFNSIVNLLNLVDEKAFCHNLEFESDKYFNNILNCSYGILLVFILNFKRVKLNLKKNCIKFQSSFMLNQFLSNQI